MACDESSIDFETLLQSQLLELSGVDGGKEAVARVSTPSTWTGRTSSFWSFLFSDYSGQDLSGIDSLSYTERELCLTNVWSAEVLPAWDSMQDSRRIRQLYHKGVPVTVRGDVWRRAIGNDLLIQPSLYAELAGLAEERRAQFETDHIHAEKNRLLATTAQAILVDVPRIFPHLRFFHDSQCSHLSENLTKLLEAYVMLRPDVGYSQGMSFLGAMLLLYMEPHNAFISFVNILNQSRLLYFFQNRVDMVSRTKILTPCLPGDHLNDSLLLFLHHTFTPSG